MSIQDASLLSGHEKAKKESRVERKVVSSRSRAGSAQSMDMDMDLQNGADRCDINNEEMDVMVNGPSSSLLVTDTDFVTSGTIANRILKGMFNFMSSHNRFVCQSCSFGCFPCS